MSFAIERKIKKFDKLLIKKGIKNNHFLSQLSKRDVYIILNIIILLYCRDFLISKIYYCEVTAN